MPQILTGRAHTRLFLCILFFFLGAFPAAGRGEASEPELYIRFQIDHLERNRSLFLGEAALLRGRPDLVWKASCLKITPRGEKLTSEEMLQHLVDAGFGGVLLSLRMPREIPVVPEAPMDRLVRSLANWTWRVRVEYEGSFPGGALSSPRKITPGTSRTVLRFQDGTILPIRIHWYQPVCTAQKVLPDGTLIGKEDICLASTERSGGRIPALPVQTLGARTSKNIPQGAAIYTSDIDLLPAVTRGQRVVLLYRSGSLSVQARGEALEGGALGDIIAVRNERTQRTVEGRICRPGVVEVR